MKLLDLYKGAVITNKHKVEVSPKKCIAPFIAALKEHKAKILVNAITSGSINISDTEQKPIYSNVLVQAVLPFQSADETYNMTICLTYRTDYGVKIYRCWYDTENMSYYVDNSREIFAYDFDNIDYSIIDHLIQIPYPKINESKKLDCNELKKILGSWSIDCSSMVLAITKDKVKLAENLPIRCFKRIQKRHFLDTISIKELRRDFSFLLIEDLKKDLFNIYEKSLLINKLLNENC